MRMKQSKYLQRVALLFLSVQCYSTINNAIAIHHHHHHRQHRHHHQQHWNHYSRDHKQRQWHKILLAKNKLTQRQWININSRYHHHQKKKQPLPCCLVELAFVQHSFPQFQRRDDIHERSLHEITKKSFLTLDSCPRCCSKQRMNITWKKEREESFHFESNSR